MSFNKSLRCQYKLALFAIALAHYVRAQQIQFVNVPETVTDGTDDIAISWTGGTPGTPWTVQLVQDGRVIDGQIDDDDDDDIAGQTFEWDVELENTPGGWYSLRIIQGTQTVDSAPINIIDENGVGATGPPPGTTPTSSALESVPPSASAAPTDAVASQSASIAATASTLVTTVISGTTITAIPDEAAPTGNSTNNITGQTTDGGGGLSGGAIAGIVIGVLVLLALIALLAFCLIRRRRRRISHLPTNEKGPKDPSYSTPAAFSGVAHSGDTHADDPKGGIKPELPADDKPLRTQPGMHEISSPDATTSPANGPHEMYSPDGSQTGGGGVAGTGLSHSRSDASGTVYSGGNRSSVSEVMGSPVEGSQGSVSPQMGQVVPRKAVGGGGQGQQPATIHEMG